MAKLPVEFQIKAQKLAEKLFEKKSVNDKKKICEDFVSEFKKRCTNNSTRMGYWTQIRKIILENNLEDCLQFLYEIDVKSEMNKNYSEKIAQKAKGEDNNIIILSRNDVDFLLGIAKKALTSKSIFEKMAGLALLTGRREVEIGLTAFFEKKGVNLLFKGQAKGRSKSEKIFMIPCLENSEQCIKSLIILQKRFENYDAEKFNTSFSKSINNAVKKIYKMPLSMHDLRAIYAAICVEKYRNGSHCTFFDDNLKACDFTVNGFIAQILGHGKNDLGTANSYLSRVKITF